MPRATTLNLSGSSAYTNKTSGPAEATARAEAHQAIQYNPQSISSPQCQSFHPRLDRPTMKLITRTSFSTPTLFAANFRRRSLSRDKLAISPGGKLHKTTSNFQTQQYSMAQSRPSNQLTDTCTEKQGVLWIHKRTATFRTLALLAHRSVLRGVIYQVTLRH